MPVHYKQYNVSLKDKQSFNYIDSISLTIEESQNSYRIISLELYTKQLPIMHI